AFLRALRDPLLDQPCQQRAVTARRVRAGGRAEQGDRLALRDAPGQIPDGLRLRLHLFQVAAAVLLPADRRAVLAVEGGVQLATGTEVLLPGIPGLVLLPQPARAVAADQQPKAVVGLGRVVPALGLDPATHP